MYVNNKKLIVMTRKEKQKDKKKMKEKSSFSYWNLEREWGRQSYIDQCNLNLKNLVSMV